ncbi:Insulin-like growth factor-binding protein complex acid labile subunit [Holothuria leucospilota]|uniref:Insulin-like growth factor-binding protein complex acid labile subunit n=1 Tax=Holothuria leucospilota TaxID=206669 RepID=A0A9Q1CNA6_HOLLE|nr:Insulin-like growth factor-binding protein complex acid labile subunit [Holothuria leucospilota]
MSALLVEVILLTVVSLASSQSIILYVCPFSQTISPRIKLDCTGRLRNLTESITAIPPNTEILLLQQNDLHNRLITPEVFKNLTHLRVLNLSYNAFTCFPFKFLPNLRELYMTNNEPLRTIHLDMILHLQQLNIVDLSNNHIERLSEISPSCIPQPEIPTPPPQNVESRIRWLSLRNNSLDQEDLTYLSNLTHLSHLDLSLNKIEFIDKKQFPSLPNLGSLFLDDNRISRIKLPILDRVENISLHGNALADLHAYAFQSLPSLRHMSLSNNAIRAIAPGTFNGTKLFALELQGNQLGLIRDGDIFFGQDQLYFLELSYNSMETIPQHFFRGLDSLNDLRMDYNYLSVLTTNAFAGMPKLRYLSLIGNKLQRTDNAFRVISNLQFLHLEENMISQIENDAFELNAQLVEIHLDYNHLQEVPRAFYGDLLRKRLSHLSLTHNIIQQVGQHDLGYLSHLTKLHLDHNVIQDIHPHSFLGVTSLTELKLNHNELTYLMEGTLLPLPQNIHISLHNNPWYCNCSLLPIWEFWNDFGSESITDPANVTCLSFETLSYLQISSWGTFLDQRCDNMALTDRKSHIMMFVVICCGIIVILLLSLGIVLSICKLCGLNSSSVSKDAKEDRRVSPPPDRQNSEHLYESTNAHSGSSYLSIHEEGSTNLYYSQPYAHVNQQVILQVGSRQDVTYVNFKKK